MEEKKFKNKEKKNKIFSYIFYYALFITHSYNNISNNTKAKK